MSAGRDSGAPGAREGSSPRSVGILGFGALGQHIYEAIVNDENVSRNFEVAFVWNRSRDALEGRVPDKLILEDIEDCVNRGADAIIEVCHPSIAKSYGRLIMEKGADFILGSPTAMADPSIEEAMRSTAHNEEYRGALYIPVGALWGANDLQGAANRGVLESLTITMKKHPAMVNLTDEAMKLQAKELADKNEVGEHVIYEGPVRELCPLAPNNVNTMACAALACHSLGFDATIGRLVVDAGLTTHEIVVHAEGKPNPTTGQRFVLHCERSSPAPVGAVTSKATYATFLESVCRAKGRGNGVHFI